MPLPDIPEETPSTAFDAFPNSDLPNDAAATEDLPPTDSSQQPSSTGWGEIWDIDEDDEEEITAADMLDEHGEPKDTASTSTRKSYMTSVSHYSNYCMVCTDSHPLG